MRRATFATAAAIILALGPPIEAGGKSSSGHSNGGGHYVGGSGSSHKGGHYVNPATNNHYRKHTGSSLPSPSAYFSAAAVPSPEATFNPPPNWYGGTAAAANKPAVAEPERPARPQVDEAEVYATAKKALAEGKGRAMSKDLSVRTRALQREHEAALTKVAAQYNLEPDELAGIIEDGEELDGTAAKRRKANNPLRAQNQAILGAIGAQLDQQANATAARAQAANQAALNRMFIPMGPR